MFTVLELFDLAVQIEANGEQFYRHARTRVRRDSLVDLLGWLADQELLHKSAFADLKEKIAGRGEPAPSFSSLSGEVLRGAMGPHAFSLDELQLDSIQDEEEILQAAVLFEEDTIVFFEFISSFISDLEAISTLERIKVEESNHKELLMEKIAEIRTKSNLGK